MLLTVVSLFTDETLPYGNSVKFYVLASSLAVSLERPVSFHCIHTVLLYLEPVELFMDDAHFGWQLTGRAEQWCCFWVYLTCALDE
jgi:hypothetical protein